MVELHEISEKVIEKDDDYEDIEDDQLTVAKQDQEEDSDDDYLEEESLLERLAALVDIIPPTTRAKVSNAVSNSVSFGFGLGKLAGSGLWVLTTAALLVFLPVGLELEREQVAFQQEQQRQA
ncbi:mitochondrial import receptor protein [Terramyces sp. JEL0728]|nr:mitochondrial import receptor protein [Terramyces sp. JEL0728]